MRTVTARVLATVALWCAVQIAAAGPVGELNVSNTQLFLKGYDVVSYFNGTGPRPGSSSHAANYQGAIFHFSSAENRSRFLAQPERYLPAFGGFCSYGVRMGKKLDVQPTVWQMVDGRLYLQLDEGTQLVWMKDVQINIEIANRLWVSMHRRD